MLLLLVPSSPGDCPAARLSSGRAPAGECGCCRCWSHHQQGIALPPVLVTGGQPSEGAGHGVPGCGSGVRQGGGPTPPPPSVVRPPASAIGGRHADAAVVPVVVPGIDIVHNLILVLMHPSRHPPSPPPPPPHCRECRRCALHNASSKHLWTGFTSSRQATSVSVRLHQNLPTARLPPVSAYLRALCKSPHGLFAPRVGPPLSPLHRGIQGSHTTQNVDRSESRQRSSCGRQRPRNSIGSAIDRCRSPTVCHESETASPP